MRRLNKIEKLACDICWSGFNTPQPGGPRKYWNSITPNARRTYVDIAKEFLHYAERLGIERIKSELSESE